MANVTDPEGAAYYAIARRRIGDTYQTQAQQNAYQYQLSQLGYSQKLKALQDRFNQGYDRFPGSFARRGVMDSGIYTHALQQMMGNYGTSLGNLSSQQALANQGFDLTNQQLNTVNANSMADIAQQEEARRQAIAAALTAAQ